MDTPRTPRYFRHLRQQMRAHLSLSELKVLGHDLGMEVVDLPGGSKLEKIHHFLLLLAQHGRFQPLLTLLHEHNPYVPWIDEQAPIPAPTTQQEDARQINPHVQETLFQAYLQHMTRLLQNGLADGLPDPAKVQRATTWTSRILPQLDSAQRGRLLLFLYDARLIHSPRPVLRLWQADFSGIDLRGVTLTLADLSHADLRQARLAAADLRHTNFTNACLQGSYLSGIDARGANWRWANLQQADLRHANLQGSQLGTADLRQAQLQAANLQGANFSYASLRDADLTDAIRDKTNFAGATMPDGQLYKATP